MKAAIKKRAMHRARIIQGQIAALEEAIETDAYCVAVMTQSLAIQRSLASLNKLVLENHLETHVLDALASGDEGRREHATQELLTLYELHNIRGKS